MLRYYPIGVGTGVILFLTFSWWNKRQTQNGTKEAHELIKVWPQSFLWSYLMIILMITLFDRGMESSGVPDLTFFSTLHINTRNNAFLVENILLFIPYGFLISWNTDTVLKSYQNVLRTLVIGFVTSFWIEITQLLTKRGCFQVDDIWSNALGALLGAIVFVLIFGRKEKSCV